ncbi:MAG: hypothetical protein ACI88G_000805, partial [Woeseiaceae bacterium]
FAPTAIRLVQFAAKAAPTKQADRRAFVGVSNRQITYKPVLRIILICVDLIARTPFQVPALNDARIASAWTEIRD